MPSYHQSTNYFFFFLKAKKSSWRALFGFKCLKQTFSLVHDRLGSDDFSLCRSHFKVHPVIKRNENNVLQRFSGLVGFMQSAATQRHLVISYHCGPTALLKEKHIQQAGKTTES